jgi:carboxyl-terminal processing protease
MPTPDPHPAPSSANPHKWGYFLRGLLTALVVFAAGVAVMWAYDARSGERPAILGTVGHAEPPVNEGLMNEAWRIVESDFYGDIPSEQTRTYGAIKGSVQTLDDPYTYFIEPEPAVREQERLQGKFGGIGAYLTLDEQGRVVLTPMVDRPAARAGVEKGDILLTIDGAPLPEPADLDQITDMIRGEVGTKVLLTVQRGEQTLDIPVERAEIELPSVIWRPVEEAPDAGYIRIERFSGLTDREFSQALNELMQQGADRAFIIDLRGDPGGLVDAAVAVAGHFLDGGVVLIEKHADGSQKEYRAESGVDVPVETPVILLVDGNTASAAEILAGALQDAGRATLVGEKTYGKGSIQRIHRLSDGSALHVTFAKWFTPNDRAIDGSGLEPDVVVESSPDHDSYMEKALEMLGWK